MAPSDHFQPADFDTHFKVFHELMAHKVLEILLVASPYDAYILEEDGSLAAKIINEYSGLNLSRPPRITRVATAEDAIRAIEGERFDLVLAMPNPDDMNTYDLGRTLKARQADLSVILLAHSVKGLPLPGDTLAAGGVDEVIIWSGDADLLLAIVKSVEDRLNAPDDTRRAMTRILLLVEDSPSTAPIFCPASTAKWSTRPRTSWRRASTKNTDFSRCGPGPRSWSPPISRAPGPCSKPTVTTFSG